MYDIVNDQVRLSVSEVLKNYGFSRIQKSAFIGETIKPLTNSLLADLSRLSLDTEDRLHIYPLCHKCSKRKVWMGKDVPIEDAPSAIII